MKKILTLISLAVLMLTSCQKGEKATKMTFSNSYSFDGVTVPISGGIYIDEEGINGLGFFDTFMQKDSKIVSFSYKPKTSKSGLISIDQIYSFSFLDGINPDPTVFENTNIEIKESYMKFDIGKETVEVKIKALLKKKAYPEGKDFVLEYKGSVTKTNG